MAYTEIEEATTAFMKGYATFLTSNRPHNHPPPLHVVTPTMPETGRQAFSDVPVDDSFRIVDADFGEWSFHALR